MVPQLRFQQTQFEGFVQSWQILELQRKLRSLKEQVLMLLGVHFHEILKKPQIDEKGKNTDEVNDNYQYSQLSTLQWSWFRQITLFSNTTTDWS